MSRHNYTLPFLYEPNVRVLVANGGRNTDVLMTASGCLFPFKK